CDRAIPLSRTVDPATRTTAAIHDLTCIPVDSLLSQRLAHPGPLWRQAGHPVACCRNERQPGRTVDANEKEVAGSASIRVVGFARIPGRGGRRTSPTSRGCLRGGPQVTPARPRMQEHSGFQKFSAALACWNLQSARPGRDELPGTHNDPLARDATAGLVDGAETESRIRGTVFSTVLIAEALSSAVTTELTISPTDGLTQRRTSVLGKTPMAMVRTTSGTATTISRKSMSGSPFHLSLRPRKT